MIGVDERLAAIDPEYVVYQVKEKFGTLRYYCDPSGEPSPVVREASDAIVTEAEHASATTCERCGEPGALHQHRRLLKTLCESCVETSGYASMPPPEPDGVGSDRARE